MDTAEKKKKSSYCIPVKLVDSMPLPKLQSIYGGSCSTKKVRDVTRKVCDLFVRTLVERVCEGKKVTLTNLMSFQLKDIKARQYKTPKRGPVNSNLRKTIKMSMQPDLKKKLNK